MPSTAATGKRRKRRRGRKDINDIKVFKVIRVIRDFKDIKAANHKVRATLKTLRSLAERKKTPDLTEGRASCITGTNRQFPLTSVTSITSTVQSNRSAAHCCCKREICDVEVVSFITAFTNALTVG